MMRAMNILEPFTTAFLTARTSSPRRPRFHLGARALPDETLYLSLSVLGYYSLMGEVWCPAFAHVPARTRNSSTTRQPRIHSGTKFAARASDKS